METGGHGKGQATLVQHRIRRDQANVTVSSNVLWENGQFVHTRCFTRDITDRLAVEYALRESEERYRAFIQNSSEGIWRCELINPLDPSWDEDEQVARIYDWAYMAECNDAMARMYGLESSAALVGMRLEDLFVRTDPKNEAFLRAFIRTDYRLRDAESHERAVDGTDRYFLNSLVEIRENGLISRAWGTQRDITGS